VDALKLIEKQSGFLRLIQYLHSNGETQITAIMENTGIPIHQLYSSIEKGKTLGLIKTRIDTASYPNKNMIDLTEKGKKMGEKLKEMVELINSG
jgi:predicted transcriptional regulator